MEPESNSSDPNDTAGEEQGSGSNDQNAERTVPLTVLESQRADSNRRIEALEKQVAETSRATTSGNGQATPLTRVQLQAQVDEGNMTEGEMDTVLANQIEDRITAKVTASMKTQIEGTQRTSQVSQEIARYTQAEPKVLEDGSPARIRVEKELAYLGTLGHDTSKNETHIIALRSALGSIEALEKTRAVGERETHQETGGAGGSDQGDNAARADGWPKDMPQKYREYYQDQIRQNFVADKKAAIEAWGYKPKHSPQARVA